MKWPDLDSSPSGMEIQDWKSVQHRLWYWVPAKLRWKVIIETAKEWMRDLISSRWNITNESHANTHWAIIEMAWKTTDMEYLIEILGKLGITRENQEIFNQYCSHLENMPKVPTSSTVPNPRPNVPISETSQWVASRVIGTLLATVRPHWRKN